MKIYAELAIKASRNESEISRIADILCEASETDQALPFAIIANAMLNSGIGREMVERLVTRIKVETDTWDEQRGGYEAGIWDQPNKCHDLGHLRSYVPKCDECLIGDEKPKPDMQDKSDGQVAKRTFSG